MISDIFLATIGSHTVGTKVYDRLWAEDSAGRLSRNNFGTGTGYEAVNRPGLGLVIRPTLLSSRSIARRRGTAILSLEVAGLAEQVRARAVRIRVSVGTIIVMPQLRHFSILPQRSETWTIRGLRMETPTGLVDLARATAVRFREAPATIVFEPTLENIVFGTEALGNLKAGTVRIVGNGLMQTVAGQFLAAAGYSPAEEGVWRR